MFSRKILIFYTFIYMAECLLLPTFYWDIRNPLFNLQDCDDEYTNIFIDSGSQMNFLCPSSVIRFTGEKSEVSKSDLYESMYLVEEEEFKNCAINKSKENRILNCNSPLNPNNIIFKTWYISDITSGSHSFGVNKTYFLVATSNGTVSGINNLKGGRCETNNMRIALTVCEVGSNCHKRPACRNPKKAFTVTSTTSTTTTTTTTSSTTSTMKTTKKKVVALPSQSDKQCDEATFTTITAICLILGLIFGLLTGVGLILVLQRIKKREEKEPPTTANMAPTMELDPNETLRREANRKYFSADNPTYRHSTEFKRLLSTNSASSTERHSVVPLGEYE